MATENSISTTCERDVCVVAIDRLSAALAAKPPKTKSQPATKEFIINLDDSSNSEEASEEE